MSSVSKNNVIRRLVIPSNEFKAVSVINTKVEMCLKAMQTAVGGNIEAYPLKTNKVVLYVNEEGVLEDLPINQHLLDIGIIVHGDAVLAKNDKKGEECDLPEEMNEANWKLYVVEPKKSKSNKKK